MQPKKYHNPMIALLNVELELKAEKDNAEIRVHTVEVGPPSWQRHETGQHSGPKPWAFVVILGLALFLRYLMGSFPLLCP